MVGSTVSLTFTTTRLVSSKSDLTLWRGGGGGEKERRRRRKERRRRRGGGGVKITLMEQLVEIASQLVSPKNGDGVGDIECSGGSVTSPGDTKLTINFPYLRIYG